MPVILFHMAPTHFRGGGVGVDIFFVISGYLIGGIILASADQGRFSFADFYLRRIRRIIPAFLAMIFASTIAAWLLLYPWELEDFAKSALSALASGSNIYFHLTSDYFAPDSASLPLLHSWTLGVEEQFYFIFPALALLLYRILRRSLLVPALLAISAVSLTISQIEAQASSSAGFYLLTSRGWELMVGVIATQVPAAFFRRPTARLLAGLIGLALILGSLALLDPSRNFPGFAAVPPCLGAALILLSGRSGTSPAHRLLSIGLLRIVGLASYSLYLWHWPIIVFFKTEQVIGKLAPIQMVEAAILTAIAGFMSWLFVERPFRSRTMPPRRLLALSGAAFALVAALQIVILAGHGWPQRIPPRALNLARYSAKSALYPIPDARCFLTRNDRLSDFDVAGCLDTKANTQNWLLVGDSHAAMLYGGLIAAYPATHFQTAVANGCDVSLAAQPTGRVCDDLMNYIFSTYLPTARINGLVLTSRWEIVEPDQLRALASRLRASGIKLLVIGPTPEYSVPVTRVLAEAERRGDPSLPARVIDPRRWQIDRQLHDIARNGGFAYASAIDAMCPARASCEVTDDHGVPLYFDGGHYSAVGSRRVIRRLIETDAAHDGPLGRTLGLPHQASQPSAAH